VNSSPSPIRAADGINLTKDKTGILSCWAEHFAELLNHDNPTDPLFLDEHLLIPTVWELDDPPSFAEVVRSSIMGLKNHKSTGPVAIPAELLKYGGEDVVLPHLHQYLFTCWKSSCVPQQ
jgi:hypothetical protein